MCCFVAECAIAIADEDLQSPPVKSPFWKPAIRSGLPSLLTSSVAKLIRIDPAPSGFGGSGAAASWKCPLPSLRSTREPSVRSSAPSTRSGAPSP